MKILLWLLLLLSLRFAQATSVTATLTYTDTQVLANATITATFVPGPLSGTPANQYLLSGSPFTQTVIATANSSGVFTMTLSDDRVITPSDGGWLFTICVPANTPCFNSLQNVTGSSINLSTALSAAAGAGGGPAALMNAYYADGEVTAAFPGAIYYNLISATFRCFTTSWSGCSSAGTGTVTSVTIAGTTNQITVTGTCTITTTGTCTLSLPATLVLPNGTTATTQTAGDSTIKVATDAFVLGQGFITSAPVTSVFSRTGAVVAATNDYNFNQLAGSAACSQQPALTGDTTSGAGSCATTTVKLNGTLLSGLGTGPLKNTTGTGVPSIAIASDIVNLFSSCSGVLYLGADGACHSPSGSGTVTSVVIAGTSNQITVTGTCTITTTGTCTLSIPSALFLGTDNSVAGSLQTSNSAANAHTIWGSGATTSNTINGPATVIANGHFLTCTTTSTVCVLTDGGAPITSVSNSDGTLTISPTTGAVVASIALGHANTWSALQTFGANASIGSTAHGVLVSENTAAAVAIAVGATNTVLNGNTGADPSFGAVPLAALASQAADTMVANMTAGSAVPTAVAMPTTAHGLWVAEGTATPPAATAAGTAGQQLNSAGASADPIYADFYHLYFYPSVNQNAGTVGTAWSLPASNACTTTAKTGTNVVDGTLTCTSSQSAQTKILLSHNWDTSVNPYIRFNVTSTDTTNGHTIIPTVAGSCAKGDGTATFDNAFQTAQSGSTFTMGASEVASAPITSSTVQLNSTSMTNCIAGSILYLKLSFSGSSTATDLEFYGLGITIPELNVAGAQ